MPQSTPRAQIQVFKDLKIDGNFFTSMLKCETEEEGDFDVYLMEHGVMGLLLQGLDALSRHVNKLASGTAVGLGAGKTMQFNPLVWLAQFMLRNHPGYIRDHRTPMYVQISDLAAAERGRRTLLRQQFHFQTVWKSMASENGQLFRSQLNELMQKMDDAWNLEGQFVRKLPDFGDMIRTATMEVSFEEFWKVFEAFVKENDLIRTTAFEEAHQKRLQAENEASKAAEETARREKVLAEVMQRRKSLEEQYSTISSDVYINDMLSSIISKGAFIESDNGIPAEGSLPLQGEHIMLICLLLGVWGCPCQPDDAVSAKDEWDSFAQEAWEKWLAESGPRNVSTSGVDANGLKALLDQDAFEAYLMKRQGSALQEDEDETDVSIVEVKRVLDYEYEFIVEALDQERGELLKLPMPEHQVEDVRRRLEKSREPVLAKVDSVSRRIIAVLAPKLPQEPEEQVLAAEEEGGAQEDGGS